MKERVLSKDELLHIWEGFAIHDGIWAEFDLTAGVYQLVTTAYRHRYMDLPHQQMIRMYCTSNRWNDFTNSVPSLAAVRDSGTTVVGVGGPGCFQVDSLA